MQKLLNGIVEFRQKTQPEYREKFGKLAIEQSPDSLFFACSDSRVVPNLFASTNPGDLFVVRNVGNMIPECGANGLSSADESEAAAIEFAIHNLKVSDIVVCGHSECGAMKALLEGRESVAFPNLRAWLRHGEDALAQVENQPAGMSKINYLSQLNTLVQVAHLKTYAPVQEALAKGRIRLHAWWFELSTANVYAYEEASAGYVLIDESEAARIIERLGP